MPRKAAQELLEFCHSHDVLVSTGGFIEYVLTQGSEAVTRYIDACKRLGFDIVETSTGFITIPTDDWLRLVEKAQKAGLKAKPEVGIQFGAGGATTAKELEAEGTRDPEWGDIAGEAFCRCRCVHDYDRVGRHHRECGGLADRRGRQDHQRPGT
jgi:hypothetical protein